MKGFFLLLSFSLGFALSAQQFPTNHLPSGTWRNSEPPAQKAGQRTFNLANLESGILRYWPIGIDVSPGDTSLEYITAAFDTLSDGVQGYLPAQQGALELDSAGWLIMHQNISGQTNLIVCELIMVDNFGNPEMLVLTSDTIATNQSLTGNQAKRIWFHMPFRIGPDTAFGLRLRFPVKGSADRLSVANLHPIKDTCQGQIQAKNSVFYPQSYGFWQGYNLQLPTATGGDFYNDCNGNGVLDTLVDGRSVIQLWDVSLSMRASYFTGFSDALTDDQTPLFWPNPAQKDLHMHPQTEQVHLWDMQGRLLRHGQGNYLSLEGIPPGTYVLQLRLAGQSHKKLLIKL